MEQGIHFETQPDVIPAIPLQVKVGQGISSRVESICNLPSKAPGIGIDLSRKFYVSQQPGKSFPIFAHHLFPTFQTAVVIPSQKIALHILRHIEIKTQARSVHHIRVVIPFYHIFRRNGLHWLFPERQKPSVCLSEMQFDILEIVRIQASVKTAMVHRERDLRKQATAIDSEIPT